MSNIVCFIDDQLNITVPLVKALGTYKKIRDDEKGGDSANIIFKIIYLMEDREKENADDLEAFETQAKEDLESVGSENGYTIFEMKDKFSYEDVTAKGEEAIKFVNAIKNAASIESDDQVVYMLDLALHTKDEEQLKSEKCSKTLSMAIYDVLEGELSNGNNKLKFYTSYSEGDYMEMWMERFKSCFQRETEPRVISRAFLQANCFDCGVGDEILNAFSI